MTTEQDVMRVMDRDFGIMRMRVWERASQQVKRQWIRNQVLWVTAILLGIAAGVELVVMR